VVHLISIACIAVGSRLNRSGMLRKDRFRRT